MARVTVGRRRETYNRKMLRPLRGVRVVALLLASIAGGAAGAAGESWRIGGVRFTIAGEVDGSAAADDEGRFNDSQYRDSALQRVQLRLLTGIDVGEHVSLLGELRSTDFDQPDVYALFLRLRPWRDRPIDVQAGLIPPVFGAWTRRSYAWDNPLISLPLPFAYLTALRGDAVPGSAADVYRARGQGTWVYLQDAGVSPASGLPLIDGTRYDTGVQLRVGDRPIQAAVALTRGSPSNPVVHDDNGGKTLAGRVEVRPGPGLAIGLSAAQGAYLAREALEDRPELRARDFQQTAVGADVEWSAGYWLLRAEAVHSAWEAPSWSAGGPDHSLTAWGVTGEVRYRILPGLHAAARYDHVGFEQLPAPGSSQTWDAPVSRVEVGGGWAPLRGLLLKLAWQQNWREGGGQRRDGLLAAQAVLWF